MDDKNFDQFIKNSLDEFPSEFDPTALSDFRQRMDTMPPRHDLGNNGSTSLFPWMGWFVAAAMMVWILFSLHRQTQTMEQLKNEIAQLQTQAMPDTLYRIDTVYVFQSEQGEPMYAANRADFSLDKKTNSPTFAGQKNQVTSLETPLAGQKNIFSKNGDRSKVTASNTVKNSPQNADYQMISPSKKHSPTISNYSINKQANKSLHPNNSLVNIPQTQITKPYPTKTGIVGASKTTDLSNQQSNKQAIATTPNQASLAANVPVPSGDFTLDREQFKMKIGAFNTDNSPFEMDINLSKNDSGATADTLQAVPPSAISLLDPAALFLKKTPEGMLLPSPTIGENKDANPLQKNEHFSLKKGETPVLNNGKMVDKTLNISENANGSDEATTNLNKAENETLDETIAANTGEKSATNTTVSENKKAKKQKNRQAKPPFMQRLKQGIGYRVGGGPQLHYSFPEIGKGRMGIGATVEATLTFGKYARLQSGANYFAYEYELDDLEKGIYDDAVLAKFPDIDGQNGILKELSVRSKTVELPIMTQYILPLRSDTRLVFGSGVSVYIVPNQTFKYEYEHITNPDDEFSVLEKIESPHLYWGTVNGMVGFEKSINDRLAYQINLTYKHHLAPLGVEERHLNFLGLNALVLFGKK